MRTLQISMFQENACFPKLVKWEHKKKIIKYVNRISVNLANPGKYSIVPKHIELVHYFLMLNLLPG